MSNNHVASVQWPERLPVIRSLTLPFVLSSIVAALLLMSSIAGLLFGQRGLYQPNPATLPSLLTQDVITAFVATPLLLTCLWLERRGSVRGLLLWMGTPRLRLLVRRARHLAATAVPGVRGHRLDESLQSDFRPGEH